MNVIKFAYLPFKAIASVPQPSINSKVALLVVVVIIIGVYFYTNYSEDEFENRL